MIISKTPLRVSFAGGGTDLRSFYKNNRYGAVLSTSIDSYIYISVKKQRSLFSDEYRLNYSETERVDDLEKIKNPVMRECLRFLEIDDRLYIGTTADAPAGSGLGSSSSFCVGLLNALYKFKGQVASAGRLAEEAAYIECDYLKRPMGKQDHYAAAYGGINYIRFYDDETVTLRPLMMTANNLKLFSSSILMFFTGFTRGSETILKEQDENNESNEDTLTLMKEQALELSTILAESELSIEKIGELVHEGWKLKKTLATKITSQLIDDCYMEAMNNGARGGKISGAGGGGFLTLIAEPLKHKKLITILGKKGFRKYDFGVDAGGSFVTEIS